MKTSNVEMFPDQETEIEVPKHLRERRKFTVLFYSTLTLGIFLVFISSSHYFLSSTKDFTPKFIKVHHDLNRSSKVLKNTKEPFFADDLLLKQEVGKFIRYYESYPSFKGSMNYIRSFLSKKGVEDYVFYRKGLKDEFSFISVVIEEIDSPSKDWFEIQYKVIAQKKDRKEIYYKKRAVLKYEFIPLKESDSRLNIKNFDLENPLQITFTNLSMIKL